MRTLGGLGIALLALACGKEDVAPHADARVEQPDDPDAAPGTEAPEECNLLDNTCPDDVPKCTVIQPTTMILETECVPLTGTNQAGESCTRMFNQVGNDNCDVGLFCSGLAIAPVGEMQPRVCRPYCVVDAHCTGAGGDRCLEFGFDDPTMAGTQPHPGVEGLCVPSCELFGACETGLSCSLTGSNEGALFGMCRINGAGMDGDVCTTSNECGPNMQCLFDQNGMGSCANLCDDAHPCPTGTCVTSDMSGPFGLPNNGGFCGG